MHTASSFIQFALDNEVLRFGEFTLKSGRKSPYFFNAGLFYTGNALLQLGEYYANTLLKNKVSAKQLFGPAYKGLPLASATAIALAKEGIACTVTFNRKEAKDHGEGGVLIGAPLEKEVVMIDDVITAGTAFREAQTLINSQGGTLKTVLIALDRCERGQQDNSTIADIRAQGIQVFSIITLHDIIDFLQQKQKKSELEAILHYQKEYGYTKELS